ncbi:MAG: (2Fe-2S)-binding protein [Oligoflexia bacterium]|nr:(2Fe-2S)-binding protein [Oligoflexia bacterium]
MSFNNQNIVVNKRRMYINYCSDKKPLENLEDQENLENQENQENQKNRPLKNKINIDGKEIEFLPGDTIMQAAERGGIAHKIPRYCYHPGLPIAGSCRMCNVEIEKASKLMTACSTPASNGMVVHTNTSKVQKACTGVMEFLLTNHPLDCPVCDQAGECELQEYNYEYGPGTSRFSETKRVFTNATTKRLSDKITLNMNRCINCERCIRFEETITKSYELVMLNRSWEKELTLSNYESDENDKDDEDKMPTKGLTSSYQGCLADICPVGALTFNDFRFQKRVWFLNRQPSICDACSKGCNIEVHFENDIIYRYTPIFNEKVNRHWMCDRGRISYHDVEDSGRITMPFMNTIDSHLHSVEWMTVLSYLKSTLAIAKKVLIILGTDSTCEEAKLFINRIPSLSKGEVKVCFYNGTGDVSSSKDDEKIDYLLQMKDQTANTKGLELLGIPPLETSYVPDSTDNTDSTDSDVVIYFRSGRAGVGGRGGLELKLKSSASLFLWGVFYKKELDKAALKQIVAIIPGLMTVEKSGTFINCDSLSQSFTSAITHKGAALPADVIFQIMILENRSAIRS